MYFTSSDAIWDFAGKVPDELFVEGETATAGIFATYPGKHLNVVNGFFDQVSGWVSRIN